MQLVRCLWLALATKTKIKVLLLKRVGNIIENTFVIGNKVTQLGKNYQIFP